LKIMPAHLFKPLIPRLPSHSQQNNLFRLPRSF
jgi:hypothetical protein